MQTIHTASHEINDSDLQAAREFLNAPLENSKSARRKPAEMSRGGGAVTVHHGITRARGRSARKTQPVS